MMTGDELREFFLSYFEEKGAKRIPSSSLIPHGDPTLLLTTAGMVQLKPYFLGKAAPPAPRLTSVQKCFRTTDVESVGDSSHLTFFEMLGNFSIGDYFKKEAIAWAWEFVTARLKLDPVRLWVTVYLDDDEAINFWKSHNVPEERIVRLGEADNFWGPAGDSGPCGPCSEIHYDFGADVGCKTDQCSPACKCGRFCEIWNLVFMQFNQDTAGRRAPLPRPNIDTGMGLERVSAIMQGKNTVYATDRFDYLLDKISAIAGVKYGRNEEADRSMRIIAEHSRGIAFLIADGVIPSNEGRGYVLRRLLRRAALFGRNLDLRKSFLVEMVSEVIGSMGKVYPELTNRRSFILELVGQEEARFSETLATGVELLEQMTASNEAGVRRKITGAQAFKLYDTYGFPIDITREIAARKGFEVDADGFTYEMSRQKERARQGLGARCAKCDRPRVLDDRSKPCPNCGSTEITHGPIHITMHTPTVTSGEQYHTTCFIGYKQLNGKSVIATILVNNDAVNFAEAGKGAGVILETTPFYAEMGGQVGDTGVIKTSGGTFKVTSTINLVPGVVLHQGIVESGTVSIGDEAEAIVDEARRRDIARNHTATHLLQAALREVLGAHVEQRGSVVGNDRLRFDFSHLKPVSAEEQAQVESIVNDNILQNLPVMAEEMSYREALGAGITALFGEKYGEKVRTLRIGQPVVSAELCGGTHVSATGEIGLFRIASESSVGAGLRRIEAVTGRGALVSYKDELQSLNCRLVDMEQHLETEKSRADSLVRKLVMKAAEGLLAQAEDIDGGKLIVAELPGAAMGNLREASDYLREKLGSAVIALGSVEGGKPVFLVVVTDDLVGGGYHAGNIVGEMSKIAGGGGGGKASMAQGGGKDALKLNEALRSARAAVLVKGK